MQQLQPTPFNIIASSFVDGQVVPCVVGTVTWIENPKSGVAARGANIGKPWSLQGITLQDEHGIKMKVTVWDPKFQFVKGSVVEFQSKKDQHNKLGGITVKREQGTDKQGAPTEWVSLSVSGSAVVLGAQSLAPGQQAAPQQQPAGRQPAGQPQQQRAAAPAGPRCPQGQTVGMAVKAGLDVWLETQSSSGIPWGPEAVEFVRDVAKDILDISHTLETTPIGAPAPTQRAAAPPAQAQQPAARPLQRPGQQSAPPADDTGFEQGEPEHGSSGFNDGMEDDNIPF